MAQPAAPPATPIASPREAEVGSLPAQLEPGAWSLDLDTFSIRFDTTQPLDLAASGPGEVLLAVEAASPFLEGIGVFELKSLITASPSGLMTGRLEPDPDLRPWIDANEGLTHVARGEGDIAGWPASWVRIDSGAACQGCFRPLFSAGTGGGPPVYGTTPDYSWQIWTIRNGDRTFAVTVEAPTATFDDVLQRLQPVLDSLVLEPDIEHSIWQTGQAAAVGRLELELIDGTRPTPALSSNGVTISEELDSRSLLVSVIYPSPGGGWGAPVAQGRFPLVLLSPQLGDFGTLGSFELRLAQAGYIVARIHQPASSFPAKLRTDIYQQPADTTFVLDALLGNAVAPELRESLDRQRVGIVGLSMGGTTIYGLLATGCCRDSRLDAAIAHAPTTFDYDEDLEFGETPLLIMTSRTDPFASPTVVESIRDLKPTAISTLVLASGDHLEWVSPSSPDYEAATQVTLAFLDHHLKGMDIDLEAAVSAVDGRWTPAIPSND